MWKYIISTEDGQYYGRNELDNDLENQFGWGFITIIRTEDTSQLIALNFDKAGIYRTWEELKEFPKDQEFSKNASDEEM